MWLKNSKGLFQGNPTVKVMCRGEGLGGAEVTRLELHDGISALTKGIPKSLSPLLSSENTAIRHHL